MVDKKLTIRLTNRRPVTVSSAEWPVLAQASGDDWSGGPDYARHEQALRQGELTQYHLTVRQHADGRALVYGVLETPHTANADRAGGELLGASSSEAIPWTIRQVGEKCELPEYIICNCIAALPPVDL